MSNRKIMIMPGDGIGPEVMAATMKVADWFAKHRTFSFDLCMDYVVVFPMKSMECPSLMKRWLMSCHGAVLFGAAGDHRYDNLPFELKPERGLLRMRKEMDLYTICGRPLCFHLWYRHQH